jgi:hypothetical protein
MPTSMYDPVASRNPSRRISAGSIGGVVTDHRLLLAPEDLVDGLAYLHLVTEGQQRALRSFITDIKTWGAARSP